MPVCPENGIPPGVTEAGREKLARQSRAKMAADAAWLSQDFKSGIDPPKRGKTNS